MIFHQLLNEESGCLSYLIGCAEPDQAVVVDPGRDRVDEYVRLARKQGLRITRLLEPRTHADPISGTLDLAAVTTSAVALHHAAKAVFQETAGAGGSALVR